MSNATAMSALDAHIARVRTLPLAVPEIARHAADEIRAILSRNIAAGVGPDGKPWPKTLDGHAPLANAMQSIDVRASGASIVIVVDGVEARHHLGMVRGGVRRELIPTSRIPGPMIEALSRLTAEVLDRHMAGAS